MQAIIPEEPSEVVPLPDICLELNSIYSIQIHPKAIGDTQHLKV